MPEFETTEIYLYYKIVIKKQQNKVEGIYSEIK